MHFSLTSSFTPRPHSPSPQFGTNFTAAVALFALSGYAVACVNYRGSTGFGQDALESLPGRCGRQDVDDCVAALVPLLGAASQQPRVDVARVSVFGGSHGGYLAGHLVAQFPRAFRACVMRNPVLNMAWEVGSTDIPDWCYVECGLAYPPAHEQALPTAADYALMLERSPVARVAHVRTPCLLCIGTGDRRVPPSQSIEWHRVLRARGVPTRLLSYADATHGLADKPSVEADSLLNSLMWIEEHSQPVL